MADIDTKTCLVLMPFADRFTEVYEQVYRPVCESLGVRCWRVDEVAGPGSITTDIINGVLDSAFLIADLSTQNPNVFYELGIAHTLSKDVILTCQQIEDVPFDVRSSRVIVYAQTISGAAKLRHALTRSIEAILSGAASANNPVQDALRLRNLAENPILHADRVDGRLVQPKSATTLTPKLPSLAERIESAQVDVALSRIQGAIEQIADQKRDEDKALLLVNGRDDLYIQFAAYKKAKTIYAEAVSNHYLPAEEMISAEQEAGLIAEGWIAPDGSNFTNFHREWTIQDSHDARTVALESIRVLVDIYDVRKLERLVVSVFE